MVGELGVVGVVVQRTAQHSELHSKPQDTPIAQSVLLLRYGILRQGKVRDVVVLLYYTTASLVICDVFLENLSDTTPQNR